MEELNVHIWHVMFWEFYNNKNVIETAKKIGSIHGQGVITDNQVWNWFSKFHSSNTSFRDEPRPGWSSEFDEYALRELTECNLHKKYLRISTWPQHIPIHNRLLLEKK